MPFESSCPVNQNAHSKNLWFLLCFSHCILLFPGWSTANSGEKSLKRCAAVDQFRTNSDFSVGGGGRLKRDKVNHVIGPRKDSKSVMFPSGRDYLLPVVSLSISPTHPPSYSRAAVQLQDSEPWERTVLAHLHTHTNTRALQHHFWIPPMVVGLFSSAAAPALVLDHEEAQAADWALELPEFFQPKAQIRAKGGEARGNPAQRGGRHYPDPERASRAGKTDALSTWCAQKQIRLIHV